MTRTRPALTATLAALSSSALIAGCAAGNNAQSVQPYQPSDGVIAASGSIRILNALVVSQPGSGRGVLSMQLVNRGQRDDELTSISSPAGRIDLTGTRTLTAGRGLTFGAGTDPAATVEALSVEPGGTISLRLSFARTQPVTIRPVVVSPRGDYSSVTPGPTTPDPETPTPSVTASTDAPSPTDSLPPASASPSTSGG